MSLNISLSNSTSFEMTLLSRAYIETMSVSRTVSEIFSLKNGVTLKLGVEVIHLCDNKGPTGL